MNELSLFSGAALGQLATQNLLGWRTIAYVEIDDYCQRLIRQRQEDGHLDRAPIFGDIRLFLDQGYARVYQGVAEVVSAGFPCPPFSVAGRRVGGADPRNLWPATARVVRQVRPRWVLLENVPGLLHSPKQRVIVHDIERFLFGKVRHRRETTVQLPSYAGRVLADLAALGYDAVWDCLPAAAVGAPHQRDRLWIVAHDGRSHPDGFHDDRGRSGAGTVCRDGSEARGVYPDTDGPGQPRIQERHGPPDGPQGRQRQAPPRGHTDGLCDPMADPDSLGRGRRPHAQPEPPRRGPVAGTGAWWAAEPALGRVAHGVPDRVAQLRALGNGWVPSVAALAWVHLLAKVGSWRG